MVSAATPLVGMPNIPRFPEPGQSRLFHSIEPKYSSFSGGTINGSLAGRALSALLPEDTSITRGAKEAELYRRISPSVVLIFTKEALGSGSIISADGLVITNFHVVEGYTKVGVILKPKQEGEPIGSAPVIVADVISVDQIADLALLRLENSSGTLPPPVKFGDYSKVNVGDDVNAIGHPTGEMWTYTKGYVSQVRRAYQWKAEDGIAHTADVIQTQTPINPGNSGGPLLDSSGALIGINAFKTEGEGLNFAIGVDEIQAFLGTRGNRIAEVRPEPKAECKARVLFEGRSKDNTASIRQVDTECHGKADATLVVPDDQSQPIYMLVDTTESGRPNGIIFSLHRDGKWNISYWDTTGSGKWNVVGYHPDGELVPTSYGPYRGK